MLDHVQQIILVLRGFEDRVPSTGSSYGVSPSNTLTLCSRLSSPCLDDHLVKLELLHGTFNDSLFNGVLQRDLKVREASTTVQEPQS